MIKTHFQILAQDKENINKYGKKANLRPNKTPFFPKEANINSNVRTVIIESFVAMPKVHRQNVS